MAQYAFHFDSSICTGCKTCQVACKETYKLPVNNLYRRVYNYQGGAWKPTEAGGYVPDGVFGYFVSLSCNHCTDPACVANCPTGAMQKDEETGIVWTDHDVCIGCKTCIEACPFHAPAYDEATSTTYKCDGCANRQARGEMPVCAVTCPSANLTLGETDSLPEGTSLFTYPTTGYFDAFLYALMYSVGGADFFNSATTYAEGIWDTPEAQQCFDIIAKLASYTNPVTPAQANDQDFTQNQQLVLDNKALFMPNGTWIVGEMAEAPRADGFAWGMTALPAAKAGGNGASYCWLEQAWIPAGAPNLDAAKQFVAFLYSDAACAIFAKGGAVQPVPGLTDNLEGDNKMFYAIYDNGADAAMGNFAAYNAVAGLGSVREVFLDPVNSLVNGSITQEQWVADVKAASDQMRANIMG